MTELNTKIDKLVFKTLKTGKNNLKKSKNINSLSNIKFNDRVIVGSASDTSNIKNNRSKCL